MNTAKKLLVGFLGLFRKPKALTTYLYVDKELVGSVADFKETIGDSLTHPLCLETTFIRLKPEHLGLVFTGDPPIATEATQKSLLQIEVIDGSYLIRYTDAKFKTAEFSASYMSADGVVLQSWDIEAASKTKYKIK